MAKPYDATTKRLLELRPADWVAFLGLPPGPVTLLDADLSTVSAAADRLIRVEGPSEAGGPYIVHNEFESGRDTGGVPFRLLAYSVGAEGKYALPVVSTVFLLHKGADSPKITGELTRTGPDGSEYHRFRYRAVRVWREDPERLLTGGLSLVPFAPIADVAESALPGLIKRMDARIEAEAQSDTEAGDLWTAAFVLMGVRYNKAFNAQLLQGVRRMKESVTYQAILEEGRAEGEAKGRADEARRLLLLVGAKRFGPPPVAVTAALEAESSRERLEALVDRALDVETWDELLSP